MKKETKYKMTAALASIAVLMSAPLVQASSITFNGFTMDFVDVGDAGNDADGTGYGAVDYSYQMGTYEVSESMIGSYNGDSANSGSLITLDSRGADRPATSVSWNEAARFINWLNIEKGYAPAYKVSGGANTDIQLWSLGDAGYDANNLFRNSGAKFVLPSEDEWYKTAYYDPNKPGGAGYFDYATGSDTAPEAVAGGTTSGTVVYNNQVESADITNAGGLSPYGTMAQNGNVWEWSESSFDSPNSSADESRVIRGGSSDNGSTLLLPSFRPGISPGDERESLGFRVAVVPEPSGVSLLVIGGMGLMMKRKRTNKLPYNLFHG